MQKSQWSAKTKMAPCVCINSYTKLQMSLHGFGFGLGSQIPPATNPVHEIEFLMEIFQELSILCFMNIPKDWLVWVCRVYLRRGHFRLWYHGGREDRLDLGSHWCHPFQGGQLALGDPRTTKNTNNMLKIVYQIIWKHFVIQMHLYFRYFYMIYQMFFLSSAAVC